MNLLKPGGTFSFTKFAAALVLTLGTGALGALFSMNARSVYENLVLPPFAPPGWLFAPVWTLLYLLQGVALYRILSLEITPQAKSARHAFLLQLFFGLLWSLLFFTLSLRVAALLDALIFLFYLIVTFVRFFPLDRPAAWLMLPSVVWVAFATALNTAVVLLNN